MFRVLLQIKSQDKFRLRGCRRGLVVLRDQQIPSPQQIWVRKSLVFYVRHPNTLLPDLLLSINVSGEISCRDLMGNFCLKWSR